MANAPLSGTQQRMGGPDQGPGGRLSGPYLRATYAYLAAHGLSDDDIAAVSEILGRYAEVEEDDPGRAAVQWPGSQDARQRQMAADALLPPSLRRWPARPMSAREAARFAERFPGSAGIKVL